MNWERLDDWCHRRNWIPRRVQSFLCDRLDAQWSGPQPDAVYFDEMRDQ